MTQQFGGELAKHPLLRLTGPQARPSSLWAGEGRPPGLRAEQTRRIWLKVPRERRKWCKPTPRVLAEFRGPPLALRVSPSWFRAASQSRSLSAWVRSLVSHATRPQLHSNLAGAKLDPRAQERDGPRALRAQKAPFPSSLSSAERWEPPAVTPPRRADGASEDPGRRISRPFDRSVRIRSGFPPPPDGASALAGLPGLPRRVRIRPAPPRASGGDFLCALFWLGEPPGLREVALRREGCAARPGLLPGCPPHPLLSVSSAWRTFLQKASVLSALCLGPVLPSLALEAYWNRSSTLS